MPPKLRQYLNRPIMVSIPALFEDGRCHAYILHAIEEDGLWLSSDELVARLLPEADRIGPTRLQQGVFVPSAQIAALVLPMPPAPVDVAAAPAVATAKPTKRAKVAGGDKPAPPMDAAKK